MPATLSRLVRALLAAAMFALLTVSTSTAQQVPPSRTVRRVFSSTGAAAAETVTISGAIPAGGALKVEPFPVAMSREQVAPVLAYYSLDGIQGGALLTVVANSDRAAFSIAVYDQAGAPRQATDAASPEQRLFVTSLKAGVIEVAWVNPQPEVDSGFTLTITAADPIAARGADGYSDRRTVRGDVYQDLVTLARCDPTDPSSPCPGGPAVSCDSESSRAYEFIRSITGGPADDPVVAFIGIAGLNRFALFDCHNGRARPLQSASLGQAKYFWVAYVEDGLAPFRTSIDVEFKARAARSDYEEFDPAGLVSVGLARAEPSDLRVVRIGVRRFRVRPPPIAADITFSRQGPTYGLRQWRRAYKVYAWSPVFLTGGVFIPATEIFVDEHQVIERQPGGSDALPFDSIIIKDQSRRPLFIYASLVWTQRRVHVDNALSTGELWRWLLIPELIGGFGLPAGSHPVWYVGGGWPVWGRLSLTAGAVLIREDKLSSAYHVGQRIPLNTPVESLTFHSTVTTITFGGAVDLLKPR